MDTATDNGRPPVAQIMLPADQAQEILQFLAQCPYGQVHHLVGYLIAAWQHAALAETMARVGEG